MIEELNYLVRIMALGSGLMLVAMIVANDIRRELKIPLAGLVIGAIGYLINSTPLTIPNGPFDPWVDLVSVSTTFFIWLFARNLFERPPERRMLLGAAAALLVSWFIANFMPWTQPAGFLSMHFIALVLIADLVRVGVFERDDDLVEQRRTIRLWLPLLVAAQVASILIFELFEVAGLLDGRSPVAQLLNSLLIFVLMLFSAIALFRSDGELLLDKARPSLADEEEEEPEALDLSPSESVLHDKLTAAMAEGAYRETGLTIAGLADRLDTPEHRLRALINQRLGYRNFSAFLNRHRIAEAREKLSSRDDVDLPVLTIAMDLGYNSLPTFNRAFRSETGTTPSEFRRLAFNEEPAEALTATGQN
ncbi:helix-turn-helix domain-containing protein [uncultured Erythrobacter sp.]|uniref:AraC family transcriptional regulator n=1 Tax=uncultured Erythrobacter sp. TaxID=263913 RepID=UPI002613880F|nr:helix-turn-helix domain-containing protein [uncultured Erythrobacter sp.]